jgi:hypothetical protein
VGVLNISTKKKEGRPMSVVNALFAKPDLLIIGTSAKLCMPSPQTGQYWEESGSRVEIQDMAKAAST